MVVLKDEWRQLNNSRLFSGGWSLNSFKCYRTLRLGVSTGWVGFVPNPDPTQIIRVEENMAQNRLREVVRFFGLGLVGFGSCRVGIGFITGEEI